METDVNVPARLQDRQLAGQISTVSNYPICDALMKNVSGLFAILNEQRQIMAINDEYLQAAGVENAGAALGMRQGEILNCIHAAKPPDGCGTTEFCESCGAAIAMTVCMATNGPVEKTCAITSGDGSRAKDLYFRVRCSPLMIKGHPIPPGLPPGYYGPAEALLPGAGLFSRRQ